MNEKAILAYLRFWCMANASQKLGIHQHSAVVNVTRELNRDFMQAMRLIRVQDVN